MIFRVLLSFTESAEQILLDGISALTIYCKARVYLTSGKV